VFDLEGAECVEAVCEGDADVDLGRLPFQILRFHALAEGLQAVHSCLDLASNVIAKPLLPVRPAQAHRYPEYSVASRGGRTVLLLKAYLLANEHHGCTAAVLNGRVAPPSVESTIAGHGADLVIRRDLAQKVAENGTVTLTVRGEFHFTSVAASCVHCCVDLAILAPAVCAMLACRPFFVTKKLDSSAVDQMVQRPRSAAVRNLNSQ